MKKSGDNTALKVGRAAFVVGIILALLVGVFGRSLGAAVNTWGTSLLVLLGLVVGFLNVSAKETQSMLMAGTVLVIVAGLGSSFLGSIQFVGQYLLGILVQLVTFVVPATIVVAIKAVYALAED